MTKPAASEVCGEGLSEEALAQRLCDHFNVRVHRVGDVFDDADAEELDKWFVSTIASDERFDPKVVERIELSECPASAMGLAVEKLGLQKLFEEEANEAQMQVKEAAQTARRALEPGMSTERGKPVAAGTCLYGAVLVVAMVRQFLGAGARVRGGSGAGCGYRLSDGSFAGHYWAEVKVGAHWFVAGITEDQFDAHPVVVVRREKDTRYVPGGQAEVDASAVWLMKAAGVRAAGCHNDIDE